MHRVMGKSTGDAPKQPAITGGYLALAYARALDSPDTTQNGAIIVPNGDGTWNDPDCYYGGCNDTPPGILAHQDRLSDREKKYLYVEHSERAAIYECASSGVPTEDATMYCPWAPCMECARAIIMSGISRLVVHKERMDLTPERWLDSVQMALAMLAESEYTLVEQYSGPVDAEPILVSGRLWSPKTLEFVP